MMKRLVWIEGLAVCLALVAAGADAADTRPPTKDAAPPVDLARIGRAIDMRVAAGQFMGSVLIARGDETLLSKGYGKASLADDIPNTPATKFRLGSVTKQFTAACILLLEERGKLSVEDPVKKHLPDAPAAWDSITIYHLLTHTSGIPNFTDFPEYRSTEGTSQTPEQLVARFRDKPLNFAPGTSWEYSNSGYVLLGYLIEKIGDMPYAKFVQDNVFTKLGMQDSGYDSSTAKIDRHAIGYAPGPGGRVVASYIDMTIPFSAGALYSTTEDMLRWERGLFGGKVLKPASLEKMTTPFKNNYAFGLSVEPGPNGSKIISHSGGIEGFNTKVTYVTSDKLTVIVLANLNGPAADDLSADILKVAENEPGMLTSDRVAVAVSAEALDRLAGHYRVEDGGPMFKLSRKDDHLLLEQNGQAVDLYPASETEFFAKTMDLQTVFERDAQNQLSGITVTRRGVKSHSVRVSDAEAQQQSDALAKRIRDKTATPGSEAALRQLLESLAAGTPDYDKLSAPLAAATRQQLPKMRLMLQRMGAIKSIDFATVAPNGADVYETTFENGKLRTIINLGADGKILGAGLRSAQ
jgi:CubicO group peptidase (beta-lactamase class C family)